MSRLSIRKLRTLNKGGELSENVSFANLCTFRCGGNVRILLDIHTLEGFLGSIQYLEDVGEHYYILGNGSNVLCSDKGFDGVVIRLKGDLSRIEYDGEILECGAGVRLAQAYIFARDLSLKGLECGAGIPATVGGATYMNAGAYGFEMAQVVDYVVAFYKGKIVYFDASQCGFGYRHSVFQENKAIILRVGLRLEKDSKEGIVRRFLDTLEQRKASQPLDYPSAGCVFRRIEGKNVSKLLDECGLKGLTMGGAVVSQKHANFVINKGDATARDIFDLIEIMKARVLEKTGTKIYTEIKFLGEFDENTW